MPTITASRAQKLPIGGLSRLNGADIETIRYYERVKMLPPPPRTASGRRVYGATDLRTLSFIRRSREPGFSLDEIRALLRLGGPEKASCREVREIAAHHLADIRAKLRDLEKLCSRDCSPPCLGHRTAAEEIAKPLSIKKVRFLRLSGRVRHLLEMA